MIESLILAAVLAVAGSVALLAPSRRRKRAEGAATRLREMIG